MKSLISIFLLNNLNFNPKNKGLFGILWTYPLISALQLYGG